MKRIAGSISLVLIVLFTFISVGCKKKPVALSDYFKSTDWVAEHASDAGLVIVDTRKAAVYAAGHIPGAISIPRADFYFARTQIDNQTIAYDIPTPAELTDILTAKGITSDSTIVAYDTDTSSYGGRVPWVLRVYGHEKAYVIDGGADKWKDADGRQWSTTPVTPTASSVPYAIASYGNHHVAKGELAAVIDRQTAIKQPRVMLFQTCEARANIQALIPPSRPARIPAAHGMYRQRPSS